ACPSNCMAAATINIKHLSIFSLSIRRRPLALRRAAWPFQKPSMSGALLALPGDCVLRRGKTCRLFPRRFLRFDTMESEIPQIALLRTARNLYKRALDA